MTNKMKLYSNGCPKCNILKGTMARLGYEYEEVSDFSPLFEKGFSSVPILELENGEMLEFKSALDYVRGKV
jgi:hypothetical protein